MPQDNMADAERYAKIKDLLDKLEASLKLFETLNELEVRIQDETSMYFPRDYSSECAICGKEMQPRPCGMCVHCEMVFNG